jgi:hypothetical protein
MKFIIIIQFTLINYRQIKLIKFKLTINEIQIEYIN